MTDIPWWEKKGKDRVPAKSVKASELAKASMRTRSSFREAEARRDKVIELLGKGKTVQEACAEVGVTTQTHRKWRQIHPTYGPRVDAARISAGRGDLGSMRSTTVMDFGTFRRDILGMDSPWFHLEAVKWLESTPGGSITLMLWPPEHGKSTLIEDFCTWKLAMDPNYRIGIGSGGQSHAKKVLRRVQNRFEDSSPFPELVSRYGPFAPQTGLGNRKAAQPWAATHFDVFLKQQHDERDYSMTALGIGSDVVGSRMDLLAGDDMQSIKTLGLTEKIFETFRQDWLSRPGSKGRTVLVGTRVGEEDIYTKLMDAGIIDKLILFRAHDSDGNWLWPERYSPEEYAIMRRNAGESGWERNYMQQTSVKGERTFTAEMTTEATNPMRATFHDPPPEAKGIVLSLDPGFGVNVVLAAAVTDRKLVVLGGREDLNLTSNQAIFGAVEETALAHMTPRHPWLHLIMEDKAFQHGLFGDEGMIAMRNRYGFSVGGHQTGINKYDPNLGIAAMARSFSRNEIELPGSDDPATQRFLTSMVSELHAWRPLKRGNRLKQDFVMALWFMWIWWRKNHESLAVGGSDFSYGGLPYAMTGSGLVLPTGPYGRTA